jgi:hypothetical protein
MITQTSGTPDQARWTMISRAAGLFMAVTFAAVGLVFLLKPEAVHRLFGELSMSVGLEPSPVGVLNLYLCLAVVYMYLVTLLAWSMYRKPENVLAPLLLTHAKLASGILSLVFFALVHRTLIFLVNGVVDGSIGACVYFLYRQQVRRR